MFKQTFLIIVFSAASLSAQTSELPAFRINSGFSVPAYPENFTESREPGINAGTALELPLNGGIVFCAEYLYNKFCENADFIFIPEYPGDTHLELERVHSFGISLKYFHERVSHRFNPFFGLGLGIVRLHFFAEGGDPPFTTHFKEQETFLSACMGNDIMLKDKLSLFIEASYYVTTGNDTKHHYFPVKSGLKYFINFN